jgi:hypothetical protein
MTPRGMIGGQAFSPAAAVAPRALICDLFPALPRKQGLRDAQRLLIGT